MRQLKLYKTNMFPLNPRFDLDYFFDHVPNHFLSSSPWVETETGFELSCDLPGIRREDLRLEIKDGSILVSGKRSLKTNRSEEVKEYRSEFYVPTGLDESSLEANLTDGVLTIRAKKIEPRSKQIEIK